MLKEIIEAMEIVKDMQNDQDDLKIIVGELQGMLKKKKTKQKKTNKASKKNHMEIKVTEWKDFIQETISNIAQDTAGESSDYGPVTICFVLKDAGDVSIYNGACQGLVQEDCPKKAAYI